MTEVRLIDANALKEKWLFRGEDGKPYRDEIDNAPTIDPTIEPEIEQEKERTPNENCPKCRHWEVFVRGECEWNYHCEFEPIESLRTEHQEWIPCEERLPDSSIDCLVTRNSMYLIRNYTDMAVFEDDGTWSSEEGGEIVAWMPLPEPYEGSEQ